MLTSKDIAKELHISEQTVRQYARDGVIPFVETPGGHRRFDLTQVKLALRLAKPRKLEALSPEGEIRLSSGSAHEPLRIAGRWTRGLTRASLAEALADGDSGRQMEPIPFLGIPGSSRFVLGSGSRV